MMWDSPAPQVGQHMCDWAGGKHGLRGSMFLLLFTLDFCVLSVQRPEALNATLFFAHFEWTQAKDSH